MAQVMIHTGSPDLVEAIPATIRVTSVADYVRAYDRIARALHAGEAITATVSDSTVAAWLRRLVERYGSERVAMITVTRRQQLEQLWNVDVP